MPGVVDRVTGSRWSISNTGSSCRSCAMTLTSTGDLARRDEDRLRQAHADPSDRPLVDDGLWVVNADGTGARRVAPGADGLFTWIFGWTPDSKGVVFDLLEWSAGPVVIDIASGERRLLGGFVPRMWMTYGNDFAFRPNRSPSLVAGLASKAFQRMSPPQYCGTWVLGVAPETTRVISPIRRS